MKKQIKTTGILAVMLALVLSANLSAREKSVDREARKAAIADLKGRFQTWARGAIVPKLLEWKGQLDGAMSSEDLSILNDLRSKATELRQRIHQNAAGMRKAWRSEDYEGVKAYREKLSDARREFLDVLDLLTPLAIEYRATLEGIGAEAKPHVAEWQKEGKMMWEKWKGEYGEEVAAKAGRVIKKRDVLGGLLNPEIGQVRRIVLFMLWNGDSEAAAQGDIDVDGPSLK